MKLNDNEALAIIKALHDYAQSYGSFEFGLPTHALNEPQNMIRLIQVTVENSQNETR